MIFSEAKIKPILWVFSYFTIILDQEIIRELIDPSL